MASSNEYGIWLKKPDAMIVAVAVRSFLSKERRRVEWEDLLHEGRVAEFLTDEELEASEVTEMPEGYVTKQFWAIRKVQDQLLIEHGARPRWSYQKKIDFTAVRGDDPASEEKERALFALLHSRREEDPLDALIRKEEEERREGMFEMAQMVILDNPRSPEQGEKDLALFDVVREGASIEEVAERTGLKRESVSDALGRIIDRLREHFGVDLSLPWGIYKTPKMEAPSSRRTKKNSAAQKEYQRSYYERNRDKLRAHARDRQRTRRAAEKLQSCPA